MTGFKDHFSGVAGAYRTFRPGYPPALFGWLAGLCPRRELALDCGCGNGQASVALAEHFAAVLAVDPGAEQVRHATAHPRVTYRVAPAEATGAPDGAVDLVVAAQALHWFEPARFWPEVRRVARPGAVVAAFTYGLLAVDGPVDRVVGRLYHETLRGHWPPERAHVDDGYRSLPFPCEPIAPPAFALSERWGLARLLGYLATWSGVSARDRALGVDTLAEVAPALRAAWGEAEEKVVTWPLAVRAGRV
jgi:SAM-dependent methyltransferase